MKIFTIYNAENAKFPMNTLLRNIEKKFGFVPHVFAQSAPALNAFFNALKERFAESAFESTSREIKQIRVSKENKASDCVSDHTVNTEMLNVSPEIIDALRNNQALADTILEALNHYAPFLVHNRGKVAGQAVQKFLDAGYNSPRHVIEIILGLCVKAFSNFVSNVTGIPLDNERAVHTWQSNPEHDVA